MWGLYVCTWCLPLDMVMVDAFVCECVFSNIIDDAVGALFITMILSETAIYQKYLFLTFLLN